MWEEQREDSRPALSAQAAFWISHATLLVLRAYTECNKDVQEMVFAQDGAFQS